MECANALMDKVAAQNRRTLDLLAAKCYYYYSRSYEVTDQLDKVRRYYLLLGTTAFRGKILSIPHDISLNSATHCGKPLLIPW